ncbi:hypothetical protein VTO73DRAFT_9171 [Trametes versicolor]
MNSFWDIVDWLLPPVRIVDDLTGPADSHIHRSRSNNHHSHHSPQVSRRASTRDFDKEKERERERKRALRVAEQDREREQQRQRIHHLERENDLLREQLKATREELANITSAVFPPTPDRTLPPSPCTPLDSTQPLALTPAHLEVPTNPSQQMVNSAEAALSDPKRLRVLYTALRATYGDVRQTIISQAEELASLKSFLSKTDDWSGAQLLQALADLNSEIIQLSASIAEEFSPALRQHDHAPSAAKERDREIVTLALGPEVIRLLEDRLHAGDPTLVQFALQAWEVWCVSRVLDAFFYGLPMEVNEAFRLIFEHMHREEPQPTTSRWRALTYKYAHTLFVQRRSSSDPPSPDSANPSPFNSAPPSLASSSALPQPLINLTERNLRGVIAILALAGCTDARGLHRDPLRTRFGSALSRISARAERISNVVKTGVMSGLFEAVWVPPCPSPLPLSSRSSVIEGGASANGAGHPGKGKDREREREWVKEVERERRAERPDDDVDDAPAASGGAAFDPETMENVYAGYGNEKCRVLCTVELGLAFRRRVPQEEREDESVDGDGMPAKAAAELGVGSRVPSQSSADAGMRMDRTLLLKPKVLLESVVDIL